MRHQQLGLNSALYLPLLRGDECVGVLVLGSKKANAFNAKAIALAESFRDQALIAIENTRLFNETQEALERQTATADVLQRDQQFGGRHRSRCSTRSWKAASGCSAATRTHLLVRDDGAGLLRGVAHASRPKTAAAAERRFPSAAERPVAGHVIARRCVHYADIVRRDRRCPQAMREHATQGGHLLGAVAPMLCGKAAASARSMWFA